MEAEPDAVRQVLAKLDEVAHPAMTPGSPPDLTGLLDLLSSAPALSDGTHDMADLKFALRDAGSMSPLYHDTMDECPRARQVHGPWHCAKVSLGGSAGGFPRVLEVSGGTHHRPNEANDDSDTNPEELPGVLNAFG